MLALPSKALAFFLFNFMSSDTSKMTANNSSLNEDIIRKPLLIKPLKPLLIQDGKAQNLNGCSRQAMLQALLRVGNFFYILVLSNMYILHMCMYTHTHYTQTLIFTLIRNI